MPAKTTGKKRPASKVGRRPLLLSPGLIEALADGVKTGVYPHVAARVVGISPRTYFRYMERGRAAGAAYETEEEVPPAERPYWQFWQTIEHAQGVARATAEAAVLQLDPYKWLKSGPGRDRGDPHSPGWTEQVNVTGTGPTVVEVRYINDWREEETNG